MTRSATLLFLLFSLLLVGSCKKKKDTEDDSTDDDTKKSLPASCSVVTENYTGDAFSYSYTHSYGSDGLESGNVYVLNGSSTTTRNFTYTKDGNGRVIKKDEGSGDYREYQYDANGKLSYYRDYDANVGGYYNHLVYESNKVTITQYNASNQLFSKTVWNMNGDNATSQEYTVYYSNGSTSSYSQYTYSGYDDKYSVTYILSLHDPSIMCYFRNNYTNYSFSSTSYNTSGAITYTQSATSTSSYTFNSNGTLATNTTQTSTILGTDPPLQNNYSQTFSYTGCD